MLSPGRVSSSSPFRQAKLFAGSGALYFWARIILVLSLRCTATHAFLHHPPRFADYMTNSVQIRDIPFPHYSADSDYYDTGGNDSQTTTIPGTRTTTTPTARRRPRGPIRSARLSVSAQKQVDKQRDAQRRQAVAHQDPTLLAAPSSSSSLQNHTSFAAYADARGDSSMISSPTLRALTQWIGSETQMTRVQAETFPYARQGWSLRVRSKTGSGKTLAFLVPLVERVLEEGSTGNSNSVRLLILAPTRELAQQIGSTAQELLAFHQPVQGGNNLVQVVYGGTNIVGQIRTMERNGIPNILIATPGRLVELLDRKVRGRAFQKYLQQQQALLQKGRMASSSGNNNNMMVVLDEADHVLQNFGPEMKTIFQAIPRKRQTLLFSATLITKNVLGGKRKQGHGRRPKADASSLETVMGEPIVGVQDIDCVPLSSLSTNTDGDTSKLRTQARVAAGQKANSAVNLNVQEYSLTLPSMDAYLPVLVNLLRQQVLNDGRGAPAKVVVFFPATKLVQFMAQAVVAAEPRFEPLLQVIHSRMSQSSRQRASQSFFKNQNAVLFSSDVSARGMDYPNVTTVIQYGLPNSRELYLHRLGRTARAGHSGRGLLVSLPFERISSLRLKKQGLQEWPTMDAFDKKQDSFSAIVQSAKMMASVEAAYKAFVAYYVGNRHNKQVVLDAAAEFAEGVGLSNLPTLPENLL